MTDASPPEPSAAPAPGAGRRRPRRPASRARSSCSVGIVLAVVLGIGLFTGLGHEPEHVGRAPRGRPGAVLLGRQRRADGAARRCRCRPTAAGTARPPCCSSSGTGAPSCHQELPPLAAAVRQQDQARGALSADPGHRCRQRRLDRRAPSRSSSSAGVTLPGGLRPERRPSPSGTSTSTATPTRCSSRATGRSPRSCAGAVLTPSSLHRGRAGPHSQRNVSAAASGAATAQTASTTQDSPGTAAPRPSVACSAAESASAGSSLAKVARPARELRDGDDHAAQQQEDRGRGRWPRPG